MIDDLEPSSVSNPKPARTSYQEIDDAWHLLGVGLLGGTLPTVIVAWREPDPQTSEESR